VSKNSRPHILVEYVARAIVYFAGMLPLAKAVRGEFGRLTVVSRWRGCRLAYHSGNVSDDPRVEEDFFTDRKVLLIAQYFTIRLTDVALCYHGWLRVGTGLSLLEGMIELDKRAEEINVRKSVGAFHQPVRHNLDL
jgi:acylglycerol lipase